jgi:hypothetical protein
MGGLPAGPRDLLGAVARPLAAMAIATGAVLAALGLAGGAGEFARLLLGIALVVVCWALGCLAPGFRHELKTHFLRRRA